MEGHERIAAFIKQKNDLEKQTEIQQSEIDRLKEEVENFKGGVVLPAGGLKDLPP